MQKRKTWKAVVKNTVPRLRDMNQLTRGLTRHTGTGQMFLQAKECQRLGASSKARKM